MLQQQLRNSCKLMFVVAGERRLSVGSSLSSETGRSWSSRQEATGMSTFCYCTMFIGLSNYHIGPYRRAWTEQLDLEIAHLVGCLRSEVQVSASFQSSCPPRGSVRVRTLPDLCPRGETQTVLNPVLWQSWMAAFPGYTLQMKTPFPGWPIMIHCMHTRRRILPGGLDRVRSTSFQKIPHFVGRLGRKVIVWSKQVNKSLWVLCVVRSFRGLGAQFRSDAVRFAPMR